jgi:indole-3-glycerol phosphate synthase
MKTEKSILSTIGEYALERVAREKTICPTETIRAMALETNRNTGFPFEKALAGDEISFICECKKASPSKGLIAPEFPYLEIAKAYEQAGASAISVLTEPHWFLGEDRYLKEIAETVTIPCLRKDFTVDEYMIYQAKLLGASAVLLICSLLDTDTLSRYLEIADELGLSALVEAHDEGEIQQAIRAGARIIGVNNRNLKDFSVDIGNSGRLRELVPPEILFVAESGIRTGEQVEALRQAGVNAVLIGETLMRAPDKRKMLDSLRGTERTVR